MEMSKSCCGQRRGAHRRNFPASGVGRDAASLDSPGGLGVVAGGDDLPYLPSALAKRDENYNNRMTADTDAKCFLPGVPRIMYQPYPFQIFQTPTVLAMAFQYHHAMRNVYMNTPHPEGPIQWWMGDSRGRWGRRHAGGGRRPLHRRDMVRPHR